MHPSIRRPSQLRLLIVGGGPSAFYSAARVLSHFPKEDASRAQNVEVHMYERLPTPHGLVRYGVAPDHPEVKNVEHKFAEVAKDPRFHFFGNVNLGAEEQEARGTSTDYPLANHLSLSSVLPHYTHILFAYGSSKSRPLGIPGSEPGEVSNVYSALDFVNWYNGHPVAHDASLTSSATVDLSSIKGEHMTVVGAGNVALDVARIVLRSACAALDSEANTTVAREELAKTDVPEPVLAALSALRLKQVDIYARRGPAQLAFTNKELREILALPGIAFRPPDAEQLQSAVKTVEEAEKAGVGSPEAKSEARVKKRLLSLLAKGSTHKLSTDSSSSGKSWGLNFFHAPAELHGESSTAGAPLRHVTWNLTQLAPKAAQQGALSGAAASETTTWGSGQPATSGGSPSSSQTPTTTGQQVCTNTDLLVSSIGYRSEQIAPEEPFDTKNAIVPNEGGRVKTLQGERVPGQYVSGWLARGPVGVIASTMYDAYSVADLIVQDHQNSVSRLVGGQKGQTVGRLPAALEQPKNKVVSYADWERIDQVEKERGAKLGKLREKILTVKEMLEVVS